MEGLGTAMAVSTAADQTASGDTDGQGPTVTDVLTSFPPRSGKTMQD